MKKLRFIWFMFIIALSSVSELYSAPKRPTISEQGWSEVHSIHPVVFNLVKVDSHKNEKLSESPSILIQEYPLEEKWLKAFKSKKLNAENCFREDSSGWNQLWCKRSSSILVMLSKKITSQDKKIEEQVTKWVMAHE